MHFIQPRVEGRRRPWDSHGLHSIVDNDGAFGQQFPVCCTVVAAMLQVRPAPGAFDIVTVQHGIFTGIYLCNDGALSQHFPVCCTVADKMP